MDKAIIQEGDMVLMQIIIRSIVRKEFVSFCYTINGHLCVYSEGSMLTIDEMKGANLIKLDFVKDKDIINKHTIHYTDRYFRVNTHTWTGERTLPWGFVRVRDEFLKFRKSWNNQMREYVKPWSKINIAKN